LKALITGGAGFIGSHLAEALLSRGETVHAIDDLSTGRMENVRHLVGNSKFRIAVESIHNETVMDRLVSECDLIYHLAAAVGVNLIIHRPVDVIETNVLGTGMVLKLASRHLKKVLITSTSEIYGKNSKTPLNEEDDRILGPTTKSRWSYSSSKAIDEYLSMAYHRERNLEVTIVRLFNTIGPRQTGRYGMVVPRFIAQARKGEPISVYGTGQQIRCFAYVSDVVRAMIELPKHPGAAGEIFNLGNDEPIRIVELAEKVKEMTGATSDIEFIPYDQAYEKGFEDMEVRVPDLSKINALIGYRPEVCLDEGLKRIIASCGTKP